MPHTGVERKINVERWVEGGKREAEDTYERKFTCMREFTVGANLL